MVESGLLRNLGSTVYVTFRRRRWLLVGLLILCAVPGSLLLWMPVGIRLVYGYVLLAFTALTFTFALLPFANIVKVLPAVLLERNGDREKYAPAGLGDLARTMGGKRAP